MPMAEDRSSTQDFVFRLLTPFHFPHNIKT
jgi:hypothetical protein